MSTPGRRVVVVGSGAAGLSAALSAARGHGHAHARISCPLDGAGFPDYQAEKPGGKVRGRSLSPNSVAAGPDIVGRIRVDPTGRDHATEAEQAAGMDADWSRRCSWARSNMEWMCTPTPARAACAWTTTRLSESLVEPSALSAGRSSGWSAVPSAAVYRVHAARFAYGEGVTAGLRRRQCVGQSVWIRLSGRWRYDRAGAHVRVVGRRGGPRD